MSLKLLATLLLMLVAAAAFPESKSAQDNPQFLYRLTPARADMLKTGLTPQEQAITAQHFDYLKDLHARGILILAGRTLNTDESSFGIVVIRAESEDAARRIMNADPGVVKGLQRATLFPYRVALLEGRPSE